MMNGGSQFAEGYAIGRDTNNNGNGMWGNDAWWIIVLLLFGYGRNGFGGGYGGGGYYPNPASQADLSAAFASNALQRGIDDILLAQNSGFANVQQTLCQGFNGINTAILQNGNAMERGFATTSFNVQNSFNSLANQIAQCCCDLKSMNLENRYLNEKQTCEIVGAINNSYQRLMDWQVNEKLNSVMAENASLKGQISNYNQTNDIVSKLRDPGCPVASYNVPNPNCCYNPFGFTYGFTNNNNGNCCGNANIL